jgi:hypothetical protein
MPCPYFFVSHLGLSCGGGETLISDLILHRRQDALSKIQIPNSEIRMKFVGNFLLFIFII